MSKFLVFYGCLLLTFIHSITADVPYKCIHEQLETSHVPAGKMPYSRTRGRRYKRDAKLLQPLTIHTHIDDIDPSIPQNVMYNIDFALKRVEKQLAETLQVIRTFNPFVLERTSCRRTWSSGPNKGRCAQLATKSPKESAEFCSLNKSSFMIPERYMNALNAFDYDEETPTDSLPKGDGVDDANFILFVMSKTTSLCKEKGTQAYGSYCRLDSRSRPVAGLINFCPEYFSKRLYKQSHYYNIVMHEMIHILGFSSRLYSKYKVCNTEQDCKVPKRIAVPDQNGIQRLMFTEVISKMQEHFNCFDEKFGGPLDEFSQTRSGLASHWHPLLMYSSLMTPVILEDDYVVLDQITLALLSSTGWYNVDYSKAGAFVFGKGAGCDFGSDSSCETSKHLCNPSISENSRGCDVLHYTIGQCASVVPTHQCGVYRPNKNETCLDEQDQFLGESMRTFYHERRCVMVRKTTTNVTEPSCLVMKCRTKRGIEVYVNSTWVPCPLSETVKVNNLTIDCPRDPLICSPKNDSHRQFCSREENFALSVRIYFTDPTFAELSQNSNFRNFKAITVEAIAKVLRIPVNYIVNASVFFFNRVYLDFAICPPKSLSAENLSALIRSTQNFLKSDSFSFIYPGFKNLPVASTKYMLDPDVAIAFSDFEGFRMLSIVPIICAIFIIATFIASVSRYIIIQRHRPKRETIEMENIDPTPNESKSS